MSFSKSKTFKIMYIIEFCVLVVIIALNLISSFVSLSEPLNITFSIIVLIGGLYVISFSITFIVLLVKEKRKNNENNEEKDEEKK